MFQLQKYNTSVKQEFLAGITTFFTFAYILVINPKILSDAGVPFDQAFTATIIATVVGTVGMAIFANYPIVIAPAMGMNAYFAYSVVQKAEGITYVVAFSAVFVTGIIFLLLSFTSFRQKLILAIPDSLKHAIAGGIGLFIAFIGLRLSGIIVDHPSNLVTIGDFHSSAVILTLIGLILAAVLMTLRVSGALFISMIVTGVIAFFTGQLKFADKIVAMPHLPEGIIVSNPINAFSDVIEYGLYGVVFSFLLVLLFDTTGALLGLIKQAGLITDNTEKRFGKAFIADAIGGTTGSIFGTSPTAATIESSAGIAAGGKTGLTGIVVVGLTIITAFFSPVIASLSSVAAITAPSLIIVGSLMAQSIRDINWNEFEDALPAFLIFIGIPLTSSIANGIAIGFLVYPVLKIVKGKGKEVHPLLYLFTILFGCHLFL
ncbi:guanine permease [Bacillus thuringiensis]|uniref:Guanine permease n=1 Tax=Bacillus thuringiensis TaxID=1428 RepID=A0A9X7BKT6_BACTU|nr:NCS2 family permease [Bacillus thuringiensis]HDR4482646.1 NCS2 family permease [Bacillus cereus]MED3443685.1 NCS2 family permease [Bacillus thuringiensis]MED3478157.1 NCS2 family permease [Bacillus thuringiensis]MED3633174.1 NCS2 family permease [Bacillus thuringiensis]PFV27873.1 guanine permease [Bacillus thuringiensis]